MIIVISNYRFSISLRSFIEVDHLHYPFLLPRRSLDTPSKFSNTYTYHSYNYSIHSIYNLVPYSSPPWYNR